MPASAVPPSATACSPHWRAWYKQTKAHNAITFDGAQGQGLGAAGQGRAVGRADGRGVRRAMGQRRLALGAPGHAAAGARRACGGRAVGARDPGGCPLEQSGACDKVVVQIVGALTGVEFGGDPLDVGFNVTYLLDVLSNVPPGKVTCSFGDANSSMLITLPGRDDFRYVVMPMRI